MIVAAILSLLTSALDVVFGLSLDRINVHGRDLIAAAFAAILAGIRAALIVVTLLLAMGTPIPKVGFAFTARLRALLANVFQFRLLG